MHIFKSCVFTIKLRQLILLLKSLISLFKPHLKFEVGFTAKEKTTYSTVRTNS